MPSWPISALPPRLIDSANIINGTDLLHAFYAQMILLECRLRREAVADMLTERDGKSPGGTVFVVEENPEDFTRFIAWTENKGKMIRLQKYEGEERNRMRIIFSREEGIKTVDASWVTTGGPVTFASRGVVKESEKCRRRD